MKASKPVLKLNDIEVTADLLMTVNLQNGGGFTKREINKLFRDAVKDVKAGKVTEEQAVRIAVKYVIDEASDPSLHVTESDREVIENATKAAKNLVQTVEETKDKLKDEQICANV